MIIESLRVQNFRCIVDETLNCQQLIALIGPNGSGKSTFLTALRIFYEINYTITEEDFYNHETSNEIIISVRYKDLNQDEKTLFNKYIFDNTLTVQKIITFQTPKSIQKYYGESLRNPAFDSFRSAHGTSQLRKEYSSLKETFGLPDYTNKEECESFLQQWEEANKASCTRRRDDGQFFGFNAVGNSHLEKFTKFILIPAVRDAAEDAEEKKGTPLTELMDLVVRKTLAGNTKLVRLGENTQSEYEKILQAKDFTELGVLEENLNTALKQFIPDAGIKLNWNFQKTIEIPSPIADIKLIEDDYPSSIDRVGHGLQRAFILTLFQQLAITQSTEEKKEGEPGVPPTVKAKLPNLIIGIEEPELYQHPIRQRHFANILQELAAGRIGEIIDKIQIIYTTHSPLFVDIKKLDQIRSIRKKTIDPAKPKQAKITSTNLLEVAEIIDRADGKPKGTLNPHSLEARLRIIMTPIMNEGFFSNLVILVEGESDKAALMGTAAAIGINMETEGIPIIPCMGKGNMDKPLIIFQKMGILVYPLWDGDFHPPEEPQSTPIENRKLLKLCGEPEVDWPDNISDKYACFKQNLPQTMSSELGLDFVTTFKAGCCKQFCLRSEQVDKNPTVFEELIKKAKNDGKSCKSIENIVNKIITLKKAL